MLSDSRFETIAWSALTLGISTCIFWASWKGGQPLSGVIIAAIFAAVFWLARRDPLAVAGLTLALGGIVLAGFEANPIIIPEAGGFIRHERHYLVYLGGISSEGLRLFAVSIGLGFSLLMRRQFIKSNPLWTFWPFLAMCLVSIAYSPERTEGMRLFVRLCYCYFIFATIYFEAGSEAGRERVARMILLGAIFSLTLAAIFYAQGRGFDLRAGLTRFRGRESGWLPHYEYYAGILGLFFAVKYIFERQKVFLGLYLVALFFVFASLTRIAIAGTLFSAAVVGMIVQKRAFCAANALALAAWLGLQLMGHEMRRAPFSPDVPVASASLYATVPVEQRPPEYGGPPKTIGAEVPLIFADPAPAAGKELKTTGAEVPLISADPAPAAGKEPASKPKFRFSKRDVLIRMLLSLIKDNPIFGIGMGGTQKHVAIAAPGAHHPHMDYLRIFAETGVIGFTLFMATLFLAFRGLWGRLKESKDSGRLYPALGLAGLMFFCIIMLTENAINYYNGVAQFAWAYLGLALSRNQA